MPLAMADFEGLFRHLPEHRVIICKRCRYAPVPDQIQRHLKDHHSRVPVERRREIAVIVQALPDLARRPQDVIYPSDSGGPIDGLDVVFDYLRCAWGKPSGRRCPYACGAVKRMQMHCKKEHGWVNEQKRGGDGRVRSQHASYKMWESGRACQRFFKVGRWQRWFEVAATGGLSQRPDVENRLDLFFQQQEDDIQQAHDRVAVAANVVEGFESHRSTVLPWLQTTGIVDHVGGLKKDEVAAAVTSTVAEEESDLGCIFQTMECILREAHRQCFDGPDCMLTWQCRVVLGRFQSAQVETLGRTRPFEPCKNPGTLQKYFKPAKQLLAYIYRVAANRDYHFSRDSEELRRPEDVVSLTSEQARAWRSIRRMAKDREDGSTSEPDTELHEQLLEFWMLLVRDTTGPQRYRSPLVSFCAMLSLRRTTSSWVEPGNFSSHLSAMIWIVQLLIFYNGARKEMDGNGSTLAHVKRCCEDYLQQTVETPMGELLRWRLLLFHVAQNTVSPRQATWNEAEDTVSFEGTDLHMDDIPTLLQSEFEECRRILHEDLMFGAMECAPMHAYTLKDSPEIEAVGWDFTQHRDNRDLLMDHEKRLLRAIQRSAALRALFLGSGGGEDGDFAWRESALATYETTVQDYLQRLSTIVHISGGQPVREPEFFSMTWRNTQRPRHITIRHRKVMIHLQYNKSQQQTGKLRDNIRFLADPVSNLLLDYLVYVQPLRRIFLRQWSPQATLSPFLFEKGGKVWRDSKLTRCLERSSVRAGICRLHVSNWRQMTVAIVKTKFAGHIGYFEEDEDDEDAEEANQEVRIMTRQRNHKTRTVNRAYANQAAPTFGNVWDGLLRMNLRASTLWQDFWGVDLIMKDRKRKAAVVNNSRMSKRITSGIYRPRKPWSSADLLTGLRQLYGGESMVWRTPEQEQTLVAIMSWTDQVVAILPTGAGKSVSYMLPCTLPGAGVTILIVPLVALRSNMLQRLDQLQIDYLEWSPGEGREAALVVASAEAACKPGFRQYAKALQEQQKLDRVVVDECHLTVTAAGYRTSLVEVTALRSLRTQFVYLTATLPPSMLSEFEDRNYLHRPTVIRASSNRPNIMYMVEKTKSPTGSLLEQAAAEARDAWERSSLFDHARDKIILYVRSVADAETLADLMGSECYTAASGSFGEKKAILDRWIQDPLRPFIVATSALAEGFDYPHVRFVLHVDEPPSLITFSQASGRAGRDGQRAYSLVLLPSEWKPIGVESCRLEGMVSARDDDSLRKQRDQRAVHEYLQGRQCHRTTLSERLDAAHHRRWCMMDDVACGVCGHGHEEEVPPKKGVEDTSVSTGSDLIRMERLRTQQELSQYEQGLTSMRGSCFLCRGLGDRWDHGFSTCRRRHEVFRARNEIIDRHKQRGTKWMKDYTACFRCYQPQVICARADPKHASHRQGECMYRDMVLPLCYGVFHSIDGPSWLQEEFGRRFSSFMEYMDWVGEESRLGNAKVVQGVRVIARKMEAYSTT